MSNLNRNMLMIVQTGYLIKFQLAFIIQVIALIIQIKLTAVISVYFIAVAIWFLIVAIQVLISFDWFIQIDCVN